jgi:hypothetical protein
LVVKSGFCGIAPLLTRRSQVNTVPQFIVSEIQDARRFRGDRARDILDDAYLIDPAHPLIHLALAMVEDNEQTAAFLREFDLKRLPESCDYTEDLDPAEVLKLAAEMCAEQGDEKRAQLAREKLKGLEGVLERRHEYSAHLVADPVSVVRPSALPTVRTLRRPRATANTREAPAIGGPAMASINCGLELISAARNADGVAASALEETASVCVSASLL